MKKRVTWKRGPSLSGTHRLPNTYSLRINGDDVATAQEHRNGGWFWYGNKDGVVINTAATYRSLEEVKKEAVEMMTK